ncbi:MAG: hypothetical protein ACAI34_16435 [Verrucomicrobium sp.]|nr:hypothetical protein [Verrucomicrobium sp.]
MLLLDDLFTTDRRRKLPFHLERESGNGFAFLFGALPMSDLPSVAEAAHLLVLLP